MWCPLHTSHLTLKLEDASWPCHTLSQKPWLPLRLGHFCGLWALLQLWWIVCPSAFCGTSCFAAAACSHVEPGAWLWGGVGVSSMSLGWSQPGLAHPAPPVITRRPILPAAPLVVKSLGGWPPARPFGAAPVSGARDQLPSSSGLKPGEGGITELMAQLRGA